MIIGPNSNGNITIQTTTGVPGGPVTKISDNQGWDENNVGTNLPTTGGTGTGLTVDVADGGSFYSSIIINNPGSGYTNGDVITVTRPSISETFSISVPVYDWQLGNTGSTTFPGNLTIQSNPFNPGTVISQANALMTVVTTGTAATYIGWGEFGDGEPGNIALVAFNDDAGAVAIQTGATTGPEAFNEWIFDADGTLTFPIGGNLIFDPSATSVIDGVTSITASGTVGANVIQVLSDLTSFGASPAPVIYGFRSISTTGSAVNEGNISASGNLVASQGAYVSGNVTATQYNFTNGVSILSNVATKVTGSWTVTAGTNTYSFHSSVGWYLFTVGQVQYS